MARTESQATLHPLFSHNLNGMERGCLSIMQSLSVSDCMTQALNVTLRKCQLQQRTAYTKKRYYLPSGQGQNSVGPSPLCCAVSHIMASPELWGGVVTIAVCKWSIPNRSSLSAWTRHSPLPLISICKEACLGHVSDHNLTSLVRYSHNLLIFIWLTYLSSQVFLWVWIQVPSQVYLWWN